MIVKDHGNYKYDASMMKNLASGENVATVLCLPQKDRFGLSDIVLEMTATTEQSELLSSHSFLRARSHVMTAEDALRSILGRPVSKAVTALLRWIKGLPPEEENQ